MKTYYEAALEHLEECRLDLMGQMALIQSGQCDKERVLRVAGLMERAYQLETAIRREMDNKE